jgi:hypothetical protein
MLWNDHSRDIPRGSHAFLGASKYSWLNYDEEDLELAWKRSYATQMGTALHELAASLIENRIKLSSRDTHLVLYSLLENNIPRSIINMDSIMVNLLPYVSDGIGYRMKVEQPLVYSENCFGTADSIIFDEKKSLLRIHDYKSGTTPAHLEQLEIYAALFCLEYEFKPGEIEFELRIYQNGDQLIGKPQANNILPTMDKIRKFDKMIDKFKEAS